MFSSVKNSYLNITQFKIQMLTMIHLRYIKLFRSSCSFIHRLCFPLVTVACELLSEAKPSMLHEWTEDTIFTFKSATKLRVNNWLIFVIKKRLCTIFLHRPKHLPSAVKRITLDYFSLLVAKLKTCHDDEERDCICCFHLKKNDQ